MNQRGKKSMRVRYDTAKLRDENTRKAFSIVLKNRYQMLEDERTEQAEREDIERDFKVMKKAYTEVAETVLGRPRKKKKPWISDLSWTLIEEREEINKKILATLSEKVKKKKKKQLRRKYADKKREVYEDEHKVR